MDHTDAARQEVVETLLTLRDSWAIRVRNTAPGPFREVARERRIAYGKAAALVASEGLAAVLAADAPVESVTVLPKCEV